MAGGEAKVMRAFVPFRPLSDGIDACVQDLRMGRDGTSGAPLLTSMLVVVSSLEASFFHLVSLALCTLMLAGREPRGVLLGLAAFGLAILWLVLLGWTWRLSKWLKFGVVKPVRIRRKFYTRGGYLIWVEDMDGAPLKGSHLAGGWAEPLHAGSEVQALVHPRRPGLLWVPPPQDLGGAA
ncbi:MAG: hypothetical protein U0P81_12960 [Holophagaceae bacterium]